MGLADTLEALPTCWSARKQNVSPPNKALCSDLLLILKEDVGSTASSESPVTDVDTPENVFRECLQERRQSNLHLPLLPPSRLFRSSLWPTSSSPPHPLSRVWSLLGKVVPASIRPGRWAPGKPWPEEQQHIASGAFARWKDISLVFLYAGRSDLFPHNSQRQQLIREGTCLTPLPWRHAPVNITKGLQRPPLTSRACINKRGDIWQQHHIPRLWMCSRGWMWCIQQQSCSQLE